MDSENCHPNMDRQVYKKSHVATADNLGITTLLAPSYIPSKFQCSDPVHRINRKEKIELMKIAVLTKANCIS
jgi:hypothetical protein